MHMNQQPMSVQAAAVPSTQPPPTQSQMSPRVTSPQISSPGQQAQISSQAQSPSPQAASQSVAPLTQQQSPMSTQESPQMTPVGVAAAAQQMPIVASSQPVTPTQPETQQVTTPAQPPTQPMQPQSVLNQSVNQVTSPASQPAPQMPQVTQSQPPVTQSGFDEFTSIQKPNLYPNEMITANQQYPSSENVIGSTAIPNTYNMPPSTTTPTSGSTGFNSCAPLTHHQERAALQQQLQELYCMPPAPENQEKIVNIQEKLQALQQHESNDQCNGGSSCILQTPMFTSSSAVVDSPQVRFKIQTIEKFVSDDLFDFS